ncbi:MAG: archease [archaeon]|jgi:SHS2 domain-containing protein|nr:archease [archaeon]
MAFKFLPHTGDVKIEVEERTLNKAFSTAALALKEVIAEQILVAPRIKKEISVSSENKESLLYDFLEQFLYLLDTESFVISKAPLVKIEKTEEGFKLDAKLIGDNGKKYIFTNDVKAITYNEMKISESEDKCVITFVLDV